LKISIVTISFNQNSFIEECILSVLNQNYPDIEYIVVDPGSSDGSREIIDKYSDRISHIIYENDAGPADGLNKGFKIASGEIFGFLNSDDVLEPDAISKIVHQFVLNSSVDVISGHSWIIDETGKQIRRFYSDKFYLWMTPFDASILSQASTFFRSNVYRKVGGFNKYNHIAWDGELFVDMALNGARFYLVDEFLSRFRIHASAITGGGIGEKARIDYKEQIFIKVYKKKFSLFWRLFGVLPRYLRKFINYRDTKERILHGPIFGASQTIK